MEAFWEKIILDLGMPRFLRLHPPWWQPRFEAFKTWLGFRTNVAAIQVLRLTRFDSADNGPRSHGFPRDPGECPVQGPQKLSVELERSEEF